MRKTYHMDFASPKAIEALALGKVLLRDLVVTYFVAEKKYLPAQNNAQRILYPVLGGQYSVSISDDIVKSEIENHFHVVSGGAFIGEGVYGQVQKCILDVLVPTQSGIFLRPPANVVIKYVRPHHDTYLATEVALNNQYRQGTKGESTSLIPVSNSDKASALLLMPRWEGKNLEEYNITAMPFKERWHIIQGIVAELELIHRAGNVHRDLKKSNIVYQGNFGDVRIVDFGLGAEKGKSAHNLAGAPGYRPPEAVNTSSADIGMPADIYAFVVLLAEFLGAKNPLEARYYWFDKGDHYQMALAPLILAGIFEDKDLPIFFEKFKDTCIRLIQLGSLTEPCERPRVEEFAGIFAQISTEERRLLEITNRINPIFESIKTLLSSEFLRGSPRARNFSAADLDSLLNFYKKIHEPLAGAMHGGNPFSLFRSTPTFARKVSEIIDAIFSIFPLIKEAMLNHAIDTQKISSAFNDFQNYIVLVQQIEKSWSSSFCEKLVWYTAKKLGDFGCINQIIQMDKHIPIFTKLDLIVDEANRLIAFHVESSKESDILLFKLSLLRENIGNESFFQKLHELDDCLQGKPAINSAVETKFW